MRNPQRDQMSAERYVTMTDADLVGTAKVLNHRLIKAVRDLADVYDAAGVARAQALAAELQAVRYELVRRRVPAGLNLKTVNATTNISVSEVGGEITGLRIGEIG